MSLITFLFRVDDTPALRSAGDRVVAAYKGVAVVILNTLVLLTFLELAAIGISKIWNLPSRPADEGPASPRENVSYYASQDWAAQYWHEFKLTSGVRYSPYVVWRRRAPFKGTTININEDGIRFTPGADCSSNSYKVFAFGGSTIWGTGSPDWGTIPAYLQAGLEALRGKPVCVVNFGESGFVSTQEVIQLLMELESGNIPHLVLFYDGVNDVVAAYASGRPGVHLNLSDIAARYDNSKSSSAFVEWIKTSHLFSLFEILAAGLRRESKTSPTLITYETMGISATALSRSVAQVYLSNYKIVKALAQDYRFQYFFFWQPVIWTGEKLLTSEEQAMKLRVDPALIRLSDSVYQAIELATATSNYENLCYMARIFDNYNSQIWIDALHVTPVGNRLIAQDILDVVTARNQEHKIKRGT
jgi:lysophospholipase L1-like esterase